MLGVGLRQGFHMSELQVQFGRRLRQLRRQKDLTLEQFAEAAEIFVDMLSLRRSAILRNRYYAFLFSTLPRVDGLEAL